MNLVLAAERLFRRWTLAAADRFVSKMLTQPD
jgi:hypothetical protein